MATSTFASAPWQTRPVFISSTFKDMQAERDHLRHVVFPRLEEELRKGRLLLEPIDLRQGVETADLASEEARERLVLKVCLEEINRSRPFLIVLLGDRYGWVPPEERMAAATQEVGFAADVHDKSVTALEIEFGILKQSSEQRRRSFFYFRDPLPYADIPEKIRPDFSDEYSTDPQTRVRHDRLVALKRSLADDPELAPRVHTYHADWDASTKKVTGLDAKRKDAFGEKVYWHLLGELQAEIAAAASQPPQTWEDQERAALAEFIEHRRRDFTGRQQLLDDLTNLARSETPPGAVFAITSGVTWGACLTGAPGSGKSAIFAELVTRLSAGKTSSRSRETSDDSILLLTNAAGATPRGSQVEAMLERFIEELASALGIANPLPEQKTPDDVEATFASLLGRVAVKRRVVVLLDALNQFDPTPRAQHLTWLRPNQWHVNARLIATGLAGVSTDALSQWAGIKKLEVPPLTVTDDDTDDATAIAQAVWQRYHRQVNPAVLRVLKGKHLPNGSFAAGNPLWLTLALEQINLLDADDFARAERDFSGSPAERLRAMLIDTAEQMPLTVPELYGWLLAQSEKVFGVAASRSFAALIAVSRSGWRESDLLSLIPAAARVLCPDQPAVELDSLRLASLRRSFRAHLARRGKLQQVDFFHAQMRQAVTQRTLRDERTTELLHLAIADHLESLQENDELRTRDLMFHLVAGDDRLRAAVLYAKKSPDPVPAQGSVMWVVDESTQTLLSAVRSGAGNTSSKKLDWILALMDEPEIDVATRHRLARRILFDFHCLWLTFCRPDPATDVSFLEGIEERLTQIGTLCRPALVLEDLLAVAINIADRLDDDRAASRFRHISQIAATLTDTDPSNALWHYLQGFETDRLGDTRRRCGDSPGALSAYHNCRDHVARAVSCDPSNFVLLRGLCIANVKIGDTLQSLQNRAAAKEAYLEAVRIGNLANQQTSARGLVSDEIARAQVGLGEILQAEGNCEDALQAFEQALDIENSRIRLHPEVLGSFFRQGMTQSKVGDALRDNGDSLGALKAYRQALAMATKGYQGDTNNLNWASGVVDSHQKIGDLLYATGDRDGAIRSFREAESIISRMLQLEPQDLFWQRAKTVALEKIGRLNLHEGNLDEAFQLIGSCLMLRMNLLNANPTDVGTMCETCLTYALLGDVLGKRGTTDAAIHCYRQADSLAQRLVEVDPTNAKFLRQWWVIQFELGDILQTVDRREAIACFRQVQATLSHMRGAGICISAEDSDFLDDLNLKLGTLPDSSK